MDMIMKEVIMGMIFAKEERERGLCGLLYAGDLLLCSESKGELRVVIGSG